MSILLNARIAKKPPVRRYVRTVSAILASNKRRVHL